MSTFPPFPKKYKNRSYPVGSGEFWWKVWKEEYHDQGGKLGYASWIDSNKELAKKNRKQKVRK
jgi:hypothetical protein